MAEQDTKVPLTPAEQFMRELVTEAPSAPPVRSGYGRQLGASLRLCIDASKADARQTFPGYPEEWTTEFLKPAPEMAREVKGELTKQYHSERADSGQPFVWGEGEYPHPKHKGLLQRHAEALQAWGGEHVQPTLAKQRIPHRLLNMPRAFYYPEGISSTVPCFRMLLHSLARKARFVPEEQQMHDATVTDSEGYIMKDDDYWRLFQTPRFAEVAGVKVETLTLFGASFGEIRTLAQRRKQKDPRSKVYCMQSIGTAFANHGTRNGAESKLDWHNVLLAHVGTDTVTYYDPETIRANTGRTTRESMTRVAPKREFVARMALAKCAARLIMTYPDK